VKQSRRVAIVDDDMAVLDSLKLYLDMKGMNVSCFESGEALLAALESEPEPDCVVSDVRMPGLSGLELQKELNTRKSRVPLILITGHGHIDMAVEAIKAGAYDFIQKPFDDKRLVSAIEGALSQPPAKPCCEPADDGKSEEASAANQRLATLSLRQREVMTLIVEGLSNKEIALKLGISFRTVETYRAAVMEKTGCKNVVDLVRLVISSRA
jgi:two-component system response regulator FixJ